MSPTILITGANGQVGTVLTGALRQRYGDDRVLHTDIRPPARETSGFTVLDVLDRDRMAELVRDNGVTQIYHLAAILSASGEQDPLRTWQVNMDAWLNVLEVARSERVERVFFPSSIAVFGAGARPEATPNDSVLDPATVYGISKAAGENWGLYYHTRYGLDVRSLRYPGVIGHQSLPGGGTTDYAVDIFHHAVRQDPFTCFLGPDTRLPMIYMDDAIRATIELMEAAATDLTVRTSYNLSGCSFSPAEVTAAIRTHYPDFQVSYVPDFRQAIADKWPRSIDDAPARHDWGWSPAYDLERMTDSMLTHLNQKITPHPDRETLIA